jgi:hypothetical protein
MITVLQQIASHPLLVQEEFLELPESVLAELEQIYATGRRLNMKQELRLLQDHYGLNRASGTGRAYGEFPTWKKYHEALENSQENAQENIAKPCEGCGTSATSQCMPCGHAVCATCSKELEENEIEEIASTCRGCGSVVSGLENITEDEDATLAHALGSKKKKKRPNPWWPTLPGLPMPSSKGLAVKLKVLEWLHAEPNVKIVVFTQYVGM